MFRILRRVAVLFALMGLWAAVGGDYGPSPVALAQASVSDDFDTRGFDKSTYDLAALKIFNRVVLQLKDSYVDPKRIDPKLMLVAALDAVEKTVAEVMVDGDDKSSKIKGDGRVERHARLRHLQCRFALEDELRVARCVRLHLQAPGLQGPGSAGDRVRSRQRHALHPRSPLHPPQARLLQGDEAADQGRVRRAWLRHPDEGGQPHRGPGRSRTRPQPRTASSPRT